MKKMLMFILVLVGMGSLIQAQEAVSKVDEGTLYTPVVSGDITTVLKMQESYKSPFDTPAWDANQRAGASNRDSQYMRVKGNINVSSGIPGVSQWFGVLSLSMDPNSPDNVDGSDNHNVEEIDVDLTNAFIMWRPLEVGGGRPLGISIGNQTIKATANTAYSYMWGGDLDNDYVLHSMSALVNKPMINIDLHINENSGIGYAFAKGCSDFIQNSAVLDNDYALTNVVYAEYGIAGVQLNASYQYAIGNRYLKDENETKAGNAYLTADYGYNSSTINGQVSYDLNLPSVSIMPYVGYQKLWGDEASISAYQDNAAFSTKSANLDIITAGGVIKTKALGKKVTIAGGYNLVSTQDFNGLDGIEDGHLDEQIEIFAGANGMSYDADLAAFAGICGAGSSTYSVVGLDYMYNLEASIELSKRASLSIFLHGTKAKAPDNYKVTDEQKAKIQTVFETAFGMDTATATYMTEQVATGYDTDILSGTEWTDNISFGIQLKYAL
ncbi:hypothetical protein EW093_02125 [Thiospirochaeta perfilievii]|uniref:Uncharacterized protein n=1 Tax=Thiospirochaeta perfilievii TaxID=252967 RepID=A0A5C1Q6E1_9SPIO|nr:hypothetical protein [Thiospirochaeta perfilievii]QEN03545.1 hypothetical protein EW093_02125 [Thiospirochaeta perfilievii]